MARRYDTKEIRDVIGALDCAGVPAKEITRRLKAGEAGLRCGSIGISVRQVYNYRADYRAEHGLPAREVDENATAHSIEALEDRAVKLLAREIAKLEQKHPGKLTAQDISKLNRAHQAFVQMRNRIKGKGRPKKPQPNSNGKGAKGSESAIERLVREQHEEVSAA